jgi:GTP-binding protein
LHGRGTAELAAAVVAALPSAEPADSDLDERLTRVALIGRPNAGKSSLFNRLTGEERALVDARPGTTRDPVDCRVDFEGNSFVLVDTAGIRRKSKVDRGIELVSVMQSIRAIERAKVVILLCDATEGVAEQDARLLGMCLERRRAVVVGLNKMDLLSKEQANKAEQDARDAFNFASWVPLMRLSAKTGRGVRELVQIVPQADEEFKRRIATGELNRFFKEVLERQPPPTDSGRAPRIYYITQAESEPPLFVAMSSHTDYIKESYKRFVANQIRKSFGFKTVPILVQYRERARRKRGE